MLRLVSEAVKNPEKIRPFLREQWLTSYIYSIWRFRNYDTFLFEDKGNPGIFINSLHQEIREEFSDITGQDGTVSTDDAISLYRLVRSEEPNIAVETGVCNGLSTAVILKALEDNGSGELYSIDLPEYSDGTNQEEQWAGKGSAVIPSDKEPGWIIPEELREQWTLIQGDSNIKLPKLLANLEAIDLFFHDSEHSYQTMMMEYCLAWRYLGSGGLLLSDDVLRNQAFDDFAQSQRAQRYRVGSYGLLQKQDTYY